MKALALVLALLPEVAWAHCALQGGKFVCAIQPTTVSTAGDTIITMSTQYQTIQGFGASDDFANPFGSSVLDFLFRSDTGIGLTIYRMAVGSSDAWAASTAYPQGIWVNKGGQLYEQEASGSPTSGTTGPSGTGTNITDGGCSWSWVAQQGAAPNAGQAFVPFGSTTNSMWSNLQGALARNPSIKLIASVWSPDGQYKSNSTVNNGGTLNSGSYSAWANIVARFPAAVHAATGANLYAMGAQNEPDISRSYASCTYTTAQMAAYIDVLGPVMAALSPAVQVLAPEVSAWNLLGGYVTAIEGDTTAAANTSIYAVHQYAFTSGVAPTSSARPYWQTEWSNLGVTDSSMTDGLTTANAIHNAIVTGNVSAWLYWTFDGFNWSDNEGIVGYSTDAAPLTNPTIPKRAYVIGNFSKFVRPGSIRVDVGGTIPSGVNVTAYLDANNLPVVVAINTNAGASTFTAAVLGGTAPTSLNPWITDATRNLVEQSAVTVTNGIFTYSLPANSVTTFEAE